MKVSAPVKRVADYNVKIRVNADGSGVDLANVKMSMNPFDEIAVEKAVRRRETGTASEVVVVSVGPVQTQDVLRTALAVEDDILLQRSPTRHVDSLAVVEAIDPAKDVNGLHNALIAASRRAGRPAPQLW